MKANSKVKLIVLLAVSLVAILLIISVWQIVAINKKQKQIYQQQIEIERLTNMLEYLKKNNTPPPEGGSEILVEGENKW